MNKRLRNVLLILTIGMIALLTTIIIHSKATSDVSQIATPKLPDDVEQLIERYNYQENDNGLDIGITGNRIVFRGKKMLGLRSNVVKVPYFETIQGTLRSKNGLVEFSASNAEWALSPTSPLVLSKKVFITFNNQTIPDIKKARIYLRQGLLEITSSHKEIYHFK